MSSLTIRNGQGSPVLKASMVPLRMLWRVSVEDTVSSWMSLSGSTPPAASQ
jgi:hypothetical protein